jgi:hypothetical protein
VNSARELLLQSKDESKDFTHERAVGMTQAAASNYREVGEMFAEADPAVAEAANAVAFHIDEAAVFLHNAGKAIPKNPDASELRQGLRESNRWINRATNCSASQGVVMALVEFARYRRGWEDSG